VPVLGSKVQQCPTILGISLNISAVVEQKLYNSLVPAPSSIQQRCLAVVTLDLNPYTLVEQKLHNSLVSGSSSNGVSLFEPPPTLMLAPLLKWRT
jgi:hypothetical protein